MSGRRTTTPTAGRNDPCPCGSGRKFKRCCGAAPPRQSTTNRRTSALSPISAVSDPEEWSDGLGPLTEVSRLRRSAEEFIRMQSALPDASLGSGGAPAVEHEASPERRAAARRYRERGIRLVEAGRLPAAVSAFQRAIEFDPGEADSHRVLGRAQLRLDRLSEAAASLSLGDHFERRCRRLLRSGRDAAAAGPESRGDGGLSPGGRVGPGTRQRCLSPLATSSNWMAKTRRPRNAFAAPQRPTPTVRRPR